MKKLQTSYTVLNILFMSISSSLYGYAAIYLHESGLNNTQIGIVKGGGCILLVLLSSQITALVQRVEALTTRKLCLILYALICGIVFLLLSVKLSVYPLILLYMAAILLQLTLMPLTANMAMEYIRDGENLNFGFSRGMGSLFYAITAVILGRLVEGFGKHVIMQFCLGSVIENERQQPGVHVLGAGESDAGKIDYFPVCDETIS